MSVDAEARTRRGHHVTTHYSWRSKEELFDG